MYYLAFKGGVRRSFNNHDRSGTASQVTSRGRYQQANESGGKVGFKFELRTDGFQFYVFANYGLAWRLDI